jgi:hypothetical protein
MRASAKDLSEGGSEEKRRRKKMVHTETKKEEKTNNDLGGASPEQRQCVGSDVMQRSKWRRSRVLRWRPDMNRKSKNRKIKGYGSGYDSEF